jgi:hypothetical protein
MGFLKGIRKEPLRQPQRLPAGSFTVDPEGRVVSCTLPQSFPAARVAEIGRQVLAFFHGARDAHVGVRELVVHYPSLKLSAREMRGGAIIFLAPQTLSRN